MIVIRSVVVVFVGGRWGVGDDPLRAGEEITDNVRGPIRDGSASAWARFNPCHVDRFGVDVLSEGE
jgi:hypothetical protein